MGDGDPTRIGRVRQVLGSKLIVALDDSLAGVAPIYRGRLQPVGQIGSLVRLPQGPVDLVARVSMLGVAETAGAEAQTGALQPGNRWLQVDLLGEVDRSTSRFQRGVGIFPGLDDPVHFATAADLSAVYPSPGRNHVRVGHLSAAEEIPVCVDVESLVLRHGAVVGSSGSGKTTAVAALLQNLARDGWPAANIVVIDPHGEYTAALGDDAATCSVLGVDASQMSVPYWALPSSDILQAFAGSLGGATTQSRFRELVAQSRRKFASAASWLSLDPGAITADTPIPFDIRQIWHTLDWENRETRQVATDPSTSAVIDDGDAAALKPADFFPYAAGGSAPFKGPLHGVHGSIPELMRLGLLDARMAFFQRPKVDYNSDVDPLVGVLDSWLGSERAGSILDFTGVPADASELAIGVVLELLFEVAARSNVDGAGVGRPRPLLLVLEEAHRYLSDNASPRVRNAANRIAREGRKYGVGLWLVTQRPSELPDTALAQCGTIVALRLANSADQAKIRAALPDSVTGLAELLPSLRTGEAIVSGEAIALPSRMLIDLPEPKPSSDDPSLDSWRLKTSRPDLDAPVAEWRGTYDESHD